MLGSFVPPSEGILQECPKSVRAKPTLGREPTHTLFIPTICLRDITQPSLRAIWASAWGTTGLPEQWALDLSQTASRIVQHEQTPQSTPASPHN